MVLLSLQHAQKLGIPRRVLYAQTACHEDFWHRLTTHEMNAFFVKEELEEAVAWLTKDDEHPIIVEDVLIRDKELHIFVRNSVCKHTYKWTRAEIGWYGVKLLSAVPMHLFFVDRLFLNRRIPEKDRRTDSIMLLRVYDEETED